MVPESDQSNIQVGTALHILRDALKPVVAKRFADTFGSDVPWPVIMQSVERKYGKERYGGYSQDDLALLLRSMRTRIGYHGYIFDSVLSRTASAYVEEVIAIRNEWAHNQFIDAAGAARAGDTIALLLSAFHLDEAAERVRQLFADQSVAPAGVQQQAGAEQTQHNTIQEPEKDSPIPASSSGVRLRFKTTETISFLMAHNEVPIIHEVRLETDKMLRSANLDFSLQVAGRELIIPARNRLDIYPDVPLLLDEIRPVFDFGAFPASTEQTGILHVSLRDGERKLLASASKEVQVLARDFWRASPRRLAIELLASHIHVDSKAVRQLGAKILERVLGEKADVANLYDLDQRSEIDRLVEAVATALASSGISFVDSVPLWQTKGQLLRSPSQVLKGNKEASELDICLIFAAILESLQVRTLLWFSAEHCYVGYWRLPKLFESAVETEMDGPLNRLGAEQIRLFEVGSLVREGKDPQWSSRLAARSVQAAENDPMGAVLDVTRAREQHIFPLPLEGEDRSTVPALDMAAPQAVHGREVEVGPADEPARVVRWKRSLLDLSLRNRLLNYSPATGDKILLPQSAIAEFEDLLNANKVFKIYPKDGVPSLAIAQRQGGGQSLSETQLHQQMQKGSLVVDLDSDDYSGRFMKVLNKYRVARAEMGANNLYIVFGMLKWELKGRTLKAPLMLLPVRLLRDPGKESYSVCVDESDNPVPNYCLLEKLRQEFSLELPGLEEPQTDDSGIDIARMFAEVRSALADARVPFTVLEEVDLAILQFSKYRMWRDLDRHWEEFEKNALVRHLTYSPNDKFVDPVEPASEGDIETLSARSPMPADGSQLKAVAKALAGNTFVLEGPPGTGKSQTITNMLVQALAAGKKVLFVAEKRAALEVVQSRLNSLGFGRFALDLHSYDATPQVVREQLQEALHRDPPIRSHSLSANRASLGIHCDALASYKDAIHQPGQLGYSPYAANNNKLLEEGTGQVVKVPTTVLKDLDKDSLEQIYQAIRQANQKVGFTSADKDNPWAFVNSALSTEPTSLVECAQVFSAALEALVRVGGDAKLMRHLTFAADAEAWENYFALDELDTLANPCRDQDYAHKILNLADQIEGAQAAPKWTELLQETVLQADIDQLQSVAIDALNAGFFKKKKAHRLAKSLLSPYLRSQDADLSDVVGALEQAKITNKEVARLVEQITAVTKQGLPSTWVPFKDGAATALSRRLRWAVFQGEFLRTHQKYASQLEKLEANGRATARRALSYFLEAWQAFNRAFALGSKGQNASKIWLDGRDFFTKWIETDATRWAGGPAVSQAALEQWLELDNQLQPLAKWGFAELKEQLQFGRIPLREGIGVLRRSILAHLADNMLVERGLAQFDAKEHDSLIAEFVRLNDAVKEQMPAELAIETLQHRPASVAGRADTFGALGRALKVRRNGKRVRQLMDEFGEKILQLTPCAMMSPVSVAQFLPPKAGMFDVVVFDEASQIRVADAIGAMGRGKSVVVVGDSKQMPPSAAFDTVFDEDEDELVVDDVKDEESILTECVQSQVDRTWLSWHYRSKDESLIAFSNKHYYQGKLLSFPSPGMRQKRPLGLSLVRVDGQFERARSGKLHRTNLQEAEAIVSEVRRRFAASKQVPSLGIVTLNSQQQNLIVDLLHDTEDKRIISALEQTDGLFVKNLETVQGDERDTILLSVAFSKNNKGTIPLNFGPLSRTGGERRLNVAITRARCEVKIYCSFDPQDLHAENAKAIGLSHLKAYMQLASQERQNMGQQLQLVPRQDLYRDQIAAHIERMGYPVRVETGLSDFRIDISVAPKGSPDLPVLAIMLDTWDWANRDTAADRDAMPQTVLRESMGWPDVMRIWLPTWLKDKDQVLREIAERMEAIGAAAADWQVSEEPEASLQDEPSRPTVTVPVLGVAKSTPPRQLEDNAEPVAEETAAAAVGEEKPEQARRESRSWQEKPKLASPTRKTTGLGPAAARINWSEERSSGHQTIWDKISAARNGAKEAPSRPARTPNRSVRKTASPSIGAKPKVRTSRLVRPQDTSAVHRIPSVSIDNESFAQQFLTSPLKGPFATRQPKNKWVPEKRYSIDQILKDEDGIAALQAALEQIIYCEGPMGAKQLIWRFCQELNGKRPSGPSREKLLAYIPTDTLVVLNEDQSVWPKGCNPAAWKWIYQVADGESKPLSALSVVEVANAYAQMAYEQGGGNLRDIAREANHRFFGLQRIDEDERAAQRAAFAFSLATGRLSREGREVYCALK